MMNSSRIAALCATVVLATACGGDDPVDPDFSPPLNGTAFIDPDVLTLQGSNALASVTALGLGSREMYDRRTDDFGTYDVWLYDVDFSDGVSMEFQVNAEFDSTTAEGYADLYSTRMGLLPNILRFGMASVSIHDGLHTFRALDDNLVIHTEQGEAYRLQGFLEEVLAHEAVHVTLDDFHGSSSGWMAAQASDPTTISTFSQEFPEEDLAETFGVWLAVRWAPDGITDFLAAVINNAVPARLEYFDAQAFPMFPLEQ